MTGKILAVGNLKGGVGKSTVAVNLASAASIGNGSVVVVDADEQATCFSWAQEGRLPIEVIAHPVESEESAEELMIKLLSLRQANKLVVVDLPPHLGDAMAAALAVADFLIVPVTPSGADLQATTKALDLLHEARTERADSGPGCLLVPSRVDRRTGPGREIDEVLTGFDEPVGPSLGQRTAQIDAFTTGQWVGDYAPGSLAHSEMVHLTAYVKRMMK